MKIAAILLILAVLGVLFVACVIARNRKAEAERKERLKHVFDKYDGVAKPREEPKPAPAKADTRTLDEMESEEKIEAIMAAWRASDAYKEDQAYFNRKMDQAKKKYLK